MIRCPACGEPGDGPATAYLVVCEECASRTPARDLPLRGLLQSVACEGLCGGTGLVWEEVRTTSGGPEQRLVRCPDCG